MKLPITAIALLLTFGGLAGCSSEPICAHHGGYSYQIKAIIFCKDGTIE